jgi:hypothetical protein
MKSLVFFFAFSFYAAVSVIDARPVDPVPIVFVMPRRRLNLPRRRCSNLPRIGIPA